MLLLERTWEDTALLESNRSAQVRPSIGQRVFHSLLFSICPIDGLESDKLIFFTKRNVFRTTDCWQFHTAHK